MNTKFTNSHATILINILTVRQSQNTETPNQCRENQIFWVCTNSLTDNSAVLHWPFAIHVNIKIM